MHGGRFDQESMCATAANILMLSPRSMCLMCSRCPEMSPYNFSIVFMLGVNMFEQFLMAVGALVMLASIATRLITSSRGGTPDEIILIDRMNNTTVFDIRPGKRLARLSG